MNLPTIHRFNWNNLVTEIEWYLESRELLSYGLTPEEVIGYFDFYAESYRATVGVSQGNH